MEDLKYKAFFTQETDSGFSNSIENLSIDDLEENDLLIKVSYSSLNYKMLFPHQATKVLQEPILILQE